MAGSMGSRAGVQVIVGRQGQETAMPVADMGEKRAEPFQTEKCGMETQTCWTLQELRAGGHLGLFKKIRKQSQLSKLKKRGKSLILGRTRKPPRHSKGQDTGVTRQERTPREADVGEHGRGERGPGLLSPS